MSKAIRMCHVADVPGQARVAKRRAVLSVGTLMFLLLVQPLLVRAQSSTSDAKAGHFPVFQSAGRAGDYSPLVLRVDGQRLHMDLNRQPWAPGERLLSTQLRWIYDDTATVLGLAWFVDGREPVGVSVDFRRYQARVKDLTDDQLRSLNIRRNDLGGFVDLKDRGWKDVLSLDNTGVILLPMGDPTFPSGLRSEGPVLVQYGVTELESEIAFLTAGVARVWDPIKGLSQLTEREVTRLLRNERLVVYEVDPWRAKRTYQAYLLTDDGRRVNVELAQRGEKVAAEFLDGWRGPRIPAN